MQTQPLKPLRTNEEIADNKRPLRGWKKPILTGVDARQRTIKLDGIVLNEISLSDLDKLIEALQATKEKYQDIVDN